MTRAEQVARIVRFYQTLSPASLDRLGEIYAASATFIDPFNEVAGIAAIRGIFSDMYAHLAEPRFEVLRSITEGDQCVLLWNFRFRRAGSSDSQCIHGTSVLSLDEAGKILGHRDYWDPARELYEHIPVLGSVLRMIRRKLSAKI